jgi:hypothetical protein
MLQFSWVVRQQHCNTTFLKRMTLVIGSVYTLYNHVQDVRPYQSPRHPDSHGREPTHRKIVKNTELAECF